VVCVLTGIKSGVRRSGEGGRGGEVGYGAEFGEEKTRAMLHFSVSVGKVTFEGGEVGREGGVVGQFGEGGWERGCWLWWSWV